MKAKPTRNYDKWTEEERGLLMQLYEQEKSKRSTISWITISSQMKNKTPRQCYDQYHFMNKQTSRQKKSDIDNLLEEIMKLTNLKDK